MPSRAAFGSNLGAHEVLERNDRVQRQSCSVVRLLTAAATEEEGPRTDPFSALTERFRAARRGRPRRSGPDHATPSGGLRRVTIVLDTNVVSELMRAIPAPAVLAWLQQTS